MEKKDGLKRKAGIRPGMALSRKNGAEYLTFPAISETGLVSHLMTMRAGGVSEGDLWSMNLSFSRGDRRENVEENFRRAAALLGCRPEDIVSSDQTHTTNIRLVTSADKGKGVVRPKDFSDVDGLITNEPGIALATFYADCVPLLFYDPQKKVVAMAHSGWRGTAARIGAKMVHFMEKEYGSRAENIIAAVGPSICRKCYEVSEDVAQAFREAFRPEQFPLLFDEKGQGKYQLDLWEANRIILTEAGILPEHLDVTDLCTCCNHDKLFSHRASHGKRGNMGCFMCLDTETE